MWSGLLEALRRNQEATVSMISRAKRLEDKAAALEKGKEQLLSEAELFTGWSSWPFEGFNPWFVEVRRPVSSRTSYFSAISLWQMCFPSQFSGFRHATPRQQAKQVQKHVPKAPPRNPALQISRAVFFCLGCFPKLSFCCRCTLISSPPPL